MLQEKNQIDANKVALDAQKVVVDKYRAETDRMEGLAKVAKDAPAVALMEDFQPNNLI